MSHRIRSSLAVVRGTHLSTDGDSMQTGGMQPPMDVATAPRVWSSAAQIAGLVVVIAVSAVAGRPLGWIAALAPLGPLAVAGAARASGQPSPRGWRDALAFSLVAAVMIAGGWGVLRLPEWWGPAAFAVPVALFSLLLGVVNYLAVSLSRTLRAWRAQPLDYPWIPDALARIVRPHAKDITHGKR